MHRLYFSLALALVAIGCANRPAPSHEHDHASPHAVAAPRTGAALAPPAAIRSEHQHLHHQLEAAMAAGGKTGEQAREVAKVLLPHFEDEEAFALLPLGLLESLAHGKTVDEERARSAIAMAERLRREYNQMIDEHKQLQRALAGLSAAAREEGHPDHRAFAEALMAHAASEEQVLYPTTLLIGEYLKLKRR